MAKELKQREIKFQSVHKHYKTGEIQFHEWGPISGGFKGPAQITGFDFVAHRQFTGLYDKNGKEIYEGDVLFHEVDDMNEVVIYMPELAMFKREYEKGHALEFGMNTHKYISVIGNIYQNPELLTN